MKKWIFLSFIFFLSCGNETKTDHEKEKTSIIEAGEATSPNSETAVYITCAHTGELTEYLFKNESGEYIRVKVMGDNDPNVKVPKELLENAKYDVGPAGANPEMVGKAFEIVYGANDKVEVRFIK